MLNAAVLVTGELHVLISTRDPQHDPHRNWKPPPRRITHYFRCGKLIFFPRVSRFATPCREHVLSHSHWLLSMGAMMNPSGARNTFTGVRYTFADLRPTCWECQTDPQTTR